MRARLPYPHRTAPGDTGPWVKAAAVRDAARLSPAQTLVVSDADTWSEGIEAAVDAVQGGAPWAMPHRGVYRLTEAGTAAYLRGAPLEGLPLEQPPYLGTEGGGCVVLSADLLREVPLDPRFEGWGGEDESWGFALRGIAGPPVRIKTPLAHLWHPPQERQTRRWGSVRSRKLALRYRRARKDPDALRALLKEAALDF